MPHGQTMGHSKSMAPTNRTATCADSRGRADRRVRTVQLAQEAGVGFDLRREEAAEFGQSGGWGSMSACAVL